MYSGFLHGPAHKQVRVLRAVGAGLIVAVLAVAGTLRFAVMPILDKSRDVLQFSIDTPEIGPGITSRSAITMNGIRIGQVRELSLDNGTGTTRLDVEIDGAYSDTVRDDFTMAYVPQNYFGITAVSITDAGSLTASPVAEGVRVWRTTARDSTMSTMIDLGSEVSDAGLTRPTVDAIQRAMSYTAALDPLIHTGVVIADVVAKTQKALPTNSLHDLNQVLNSLPSFIGGASDGLTALYNADLRTTYPEDITDRFTTTMNLLASQLFARAGALLSTNRTNLQSTVDSVREAAGVLPAIGGGVVTPESVRALVDRLDGAFVNGPKGRQILKVKLMMERLPSIASVIGTTTRANGGQ